MDMNFLVDDSYEDVLVDAKCSSLIEKSQGAPDDSESIIGLPEATSNEKIQIPSSSGEEYENRSSQIE
jgi:hypothetical protein